MQVERGGAVRIAAQRLSHSLLDGIEIPSGKGDSPHTDMGIRRVRIDAQSRFVFTERLQELILAAQQVARRQPSRPVGPIHARVGRLQQLVQGIPRSIGPGQLAMSMIAQRNGGHLRCGGRNPSD